MRAKRIHGTIAQRFWPKVDATAGPDACWPWAAGLTTHGYGQFTVDSRPRLAHRVAYELTHGSVPAGMDLDHLCRNRRCVNPAHLDPVTRYVNIHRSPLTNAGKTHCPKGHPYEPWNVYRSHGRRFCRTCRSPRMLRELAARMAA